MNQNEDSDDDMPAEYDIASLKNGARGKYYARMQEGSNVVLLAPDVSEGGVAWEGESHYDTLDQIFEALEAGLAAWYEENQ